MKLVIALLVVAIAAAVQSTKPTPRQMTSADVEALLDPTVQTLDAGQHKLVYKSDGVEKCVVCQAFQGCGCSDIVAIRCELKRLKQKLLRLKRIAQPHQRSHHGRDEEPQPKKAVLPKIGILPPPKPAVLVKPAVVKPAVLVADKKDVK